MAFNTLVGNTDDHARNTGMLCDRVSDDTEDSHRMAWGLSPTFDITPHLTSPPHPIEEGPLLLLATGTDGRCGTGIARLADAAKRMGLDRGEAMQWLTDTAGLVPQRGEPLLREAVAPTTEDPARMDRLVDDVRTSFAYAEWVAERAASGCANG
ncbi:MAG: HipA domain-containing protein [Hydrogenophaga sp.]|nr:HipA domain-containing protein [Hydrogenophaga sp.]MDZ4187673.1 HipA domain-containing protein [Hydrogenophaga sp.]